MKRSGVGNAALQRAGRPGGVPEVGSAGDRYEVEADRLARRVVEAPVSRSTPSTGDARGGDRPTPPSRGVASDGSGLFPGTGSRIAAAPRRELESRFGHALDHVRVHTDGAASRMAGMLGARAYTLGHRIGFAANEYRPASAAGRRLLAHELVHVLQQGGGRPFHPRALNVTRVPAGRVARVQRSCRDLAALGGRDPDIGDEERQRRRQQAARRIAETGSDDDKRRLRRQIRECAEEALGRYRQRLTELPEVGQLRGAQRNRYRQAVALVEQGMRNLRGAEGEQMAMRRQLLGALRTQLDQTLFVHFYLSGDGYRVRLETVRRIGNPAVTMEADELELRRYELSQYQRGSAYVIRRQLEETLYQGLAVTREELRTPDEAPAADEPAAEPGGVGGETGEEASELSREDLLLLQEFADEAQRHDVSVEGADTRRALEILREMDAAERARFLEFYREVADEDVTSERYTSLADALERYNAMSEAQREILRTNRELADPERAGPINDEVRLALQQNAEQDRTITQQTEAVNSVLSQIDGMLSDEAREQVDVSPLAGEFTFFINEITMFKGLLAGASSRSPEIRQVSQDLLREIRALLDRIQTELRWLLVESAGAAAITYFTGGVGSPTLLLVARRLNQLRRLVNSAQRAFAVYETIRDILQVVRRGRESYERFREVVDQRVEQLQAVEEQLHDLEAPASLEAERERLEQELLEQFQQQLGEGGALGEMLGHFYIPEDASNEELVQILLDIPRGVDDLDRLSDYYEAHRDDDDPQVPEVLGAIAVRAGARLYPLVGYMAAVIGGELPSILPERSPSERLMRFVSRVGTGRGTRRRRERNRGVFSRLFRDRFEYHGGDLRTELAWGERWLQERLRRDEPGGHWVRSWFRWSIRRRVRELNRQARTEGRRVRGRERQRRRGRGGGGSRWQQVPLPRFRVRLPLLPRAGRRLNATLRLNPGRRIEVDRLTFDDFRGSGIRFDPANRRRHRALVDWLEDHGYEITTDNSGNRHLRMEGGRRQTRRRPYLQFDGSRIELDRDLALTKRLLGGNDASRFVGKEVHHSRDLPEGYYWSSGRARTHYIRRKSRVPRLERNPRGLPQLGVNDQGRLVAGEGVRRAQRQEQAALDSPTLESYDWRGAVEAMFEPDGTPRTSANTQNRNRRRWLNLVNAEQDLKRRPKRITGKLGHTVNARLLGDSLSSRHLPSMEPGDDKGHLVARRFDSPVNDPYWNLIPMRRTMNRSPGRWYRMETDMAAVYRDRAPGSGEAVHIDMQIDYGRFTSRRPSVFRVRWWVERDGSRQGSENRVTARN
ncbi:eCIS core domain-containing protein [Halomonas ramblicola]|uniref:eCIS core domain-containing protein n=1 Tax=Halomonas ramblicola TaxID=747349 RepID=UPI0025B3B3B3|nr:DUF4157 domain-containing protein [Halomonas ramblicola]MDN3522547.1 DUF4157 domain-containing protein [Halomonas ramblicola]